MGRLYIRRVLKNKGIICDQKHAIEFKIKINKMLGCGRLRGKAEGGWPGSRLPSPILAPGVQGKEARDERKGKEWGEFDHGIEI